MIQSRLPFAARFVRWWVWFYTLGLPSGDRCARLAEIESDIWEQSDFARRAGSPIHLITLHICTRFLLGVPMDLSWRLSRLRAEPDVFAVGAKPTLQAGAGTLHRAFKSRPAVGTFATVAVFLLSAGSWTAIRDQAAVGDRVDTSYIGIGFSDLDPVPYDSSLPRIELASAVPHMAVKARTQRGDSVTTLNDGRVLVVGDLPSPGDWNGAQIYSPAKNAWKSTAFLVDKRRWHTSTLLLDGRVLVTGGRERSGRVLHTVELFDPADDSWTSTSVMHRGRALHAAALLDDGRVLVVGGFDDDLKTLASAEIYDPDTRTWTLLNDMSEPRSLPSASTLHDGRVLVTGGSHTGTGPAAVHSTAEIYEPETNTWSSAGRLVVNRAGHSATVLRDGRVLVVGGAGPATNIAQAEMYDPAVNAWSPAGLLALARAGHSAALMSDGRVIIAAGWGDDGSAGHLVELFDPRVGTWLTMAVAP